MRWLNLVVAVSLLYLDGQLRCFAGSATWGINARNWNWKTAANWMPNTVPNGPGDVATFFTSNITTLSINTTSIEVDRIIFTSGAAPFTIGIDPSNGIVNLEITGSGIVNNSGVVQSFHGGRQTGIFFYGTAGNLTSFTTNGGLFSFAGSASAGTGTFNVNSVGIFPAQMFFFDSSTAADAAITVSNFGEASFGDSTTAGNATVDAVTGGFVLFGISSSADHGVFTCSAAPTLGSLIGFTESATAAQGIFTASGAAISGDVGAIINFSNTTTAGDATFVINGGTAQGAAGARMTFFNSATAANSRITVNGGAGGGFGATLFFNGQSDGGAASLTISGNGQMDLSGHGNRLLTVGSIDGDGLAFLGARALAVGSNNQSAAFSGVIQDGGSGGGTGGSLTKVGIGTLSLGGANTYTGGTTLSAGVLQVANQAGSATGTGPVNANVGTIGGNGNIAGATTIGTGSGTGAFLSPAVGTNVQARLTIQSALTFKADATYTYTFRAKRNRAKTDEVIANGVIINSGASIALGGRIQGALRQGLVLTVISNTSANPTSGTFSNLRDGGVVTINGNNFQASYSGGDGNDLTLTVVP